MHLLETTVATLHQSICAVYRNQGYSALVIGLMASLISANPARRVSTPVCFRTFATFHGRNQLALEVQRVSARVSTAGRDLARDLQRD